MKQIEKYNRLVNTRKTVCKQVEMAVKQLEMIRKQTTITLVLLRSSEMLPRAYIEMKVLGNKIKTIHFRDSGVTKKRTRVLPPMKFSCVVLVKL